MATQLYDITSKAGRYIAGIRRETGQTQIELTAEQAEYELAQGTITATGLPGGTPVEPAPVLDTDTFDLRRSGLATRPTALQVAEYAKKRAALGHKLRRCAAAAALANPLSLAPWNPPPAFSQAVWQVGRVVSNAGKWYVCGVSAASAGGTIAPTHTTGRGVRDTADSTGNLWFYLGPALTTAADPQAPVVSTGTLASISGTLTSFSGIASGVAPWMDVIGGNLTAISATQSQIVTWRVKAGANPISTAPSYRFLTDADVVALVNLNASSCMRILVDGRYVSPDVTYPIAGDQNCVILTFPTPKDGGRLIEVENLAGYGYYGVRVSPLYKVWKPAATDRVRMAIGADSLWAGAAYGPFRPGGYTANEFSKRTGVLDVWPFVKGGTGFLATSTDESYTYRQRLPQMLACNPDLFGFTVSTNDLGFTDAAVQAEVAGIISDVRAHSNGMGKPIVFWGCWCTSATSLIAAKEAAVAAAIAAANDALVFWIPLYGDPAGPIVSGGGHADAPNGAGNADRMIGGDGTHPPPIGTRYYAKRLADGFNRVVVNAL